LGCKPEVKVDQGLGSQNRAGHPFAHVALLRSSIRARHVALPSSAATYESSLVEACKAETAPKHFWEFLHKAAVYHSNIEQIGSQGRGFCAPALNAAECAPSNCCIDLDAFNKEIVMNLKRMLSCVALLLAAAIAVPAGAQTGTGTGTSGTGGTGGGAGGSAGGTTGGTMGGGSPAASSGGATSSAGDTGTTKKKSKKMRGKATRPANGGAGSGNPQ
jgi:hypothetical protein